MTEREQFLLGQLTRAVEELTEEQRLTRADIVVLQRKLAERDGEQRALKWFYTAGGGALTAAAGWFLKLFLAAGRHS